MFLGNRIVGFVGFQGDGPNECRNLFLQVQIDGV